MHNNKGTKAIQQNVVHIIYGSLCPTGDFGNRTNWEHCFNICVTQNKRNPGKNVNNKI